jgi:amino acid transporter
MQCIGYEASAHMAEETSDSAENAPRGILYTCLATGIGGLLIYLALLSVYDITQVDDATLYGTGNKVADIFIYATGLEWGRALIWMVVVNLVSE